MTGIAELKSRAYPKGSARDGADSKGDAELTETVDMTAEAGIAAGGIRMWLGLFLGISGGAVAIAVTLGLVVLLTSAPA